MTGARLAGARTPLLAGCFLLSGAASLMYQVVWLRYLALQFGNTTLAAATLLAVFMAGLGLGALVFGRWSDRFRRPLQVYALAEVGIALIALASPTLLSSIDVVYVSLYRNLGSQPVGFALGRALLAAVLLLPPTLLMGGTLPLMIRAVTGHSRAVGRASGLFYGINTAGAVLGTLTAGFVTIRLLGLWATLLLAAGGNLVAALGALAASRPRPSAGDEGPVPGAAETPRWLLALFFAMGATSLAYEVLWTRILVFYLGSSTYAYSLMLLLVLLGIAAGSLLASSWVDRLGSALSGLVVVEAAIGFFTPAQAWLFSRFNDLLVTTTGLVRPSAYEGVAVAQLLALVPVLGPPTLLMGISFPLAVRAVNRTFGRLGGDVGRVYGANTLGAVAGSLVSGFVLIPVLGTQNALLGIGAVNVLLGVWLYRRQGGSAGGRLLWLAPALALAPGLLLPRDAVILSAGMFREDRKEDLVHFHEDAQASVTIRRIRDEREPYLSLELNGVNVAGTSPDLYAVQKMQGHLPLLLAEDPSRVVHIGFGSGGTAWAVSRHPVEEIRIVEISPEVIRASDRFFPEINHGVLRDPRVRVEINDGRNFLLATPETFSAVLSDSIHPRYAGNGSLYSLEYFRLVRDRLEKGGVASMWLPTYSLTTSNYAMILKAFQEVFPATAVWYETSAPNSFTIVTGKVEGPLWSWEGVDRAFDHPAVREDLADLGLSAPEDVLSLLMARSRELEPWLAEVPPHVDDLPAVEYESGSLLVKSTTWLQTFTRLLALRPEAPPADLLEGLSPERRDAFHRRWRAQGQLMAAHLRWLDDNLRREAGLQP